MIEKLIIKNYLLLKNIEINFSNGFNIIIGETGAGKSILINAFLLLLGERADYSVIEKNKEKMVIEGVFILSEDAEINKIFIDLGIEKQKYGIILRRELYSKAYSRCFINDTPVNINDLKNIGDMIVDIHSQNEHQLLLKKETHIEFLDRFIEIGDKGKFNKKNSEYSKSHNILKSVAEEYNELIKKRNEIESKKSFLEFQLNEIKEVNPQYGEEERLEKELNLAENFETIQQVLMNIYTELYEGEGSVMEKMDLIEKNLDKIKMIDKEMEEVVKETEKTESVLREISKQIKERIDNIIYEPQKIEELRERLYKLQFLKKKHGTSIDGIIEIAGKAENDLSMLDNFDEKITAAVKKIRETKEKAYTLALIISEERKQKAKQLEREVVKYFREVGLENSEFKIDFKRTLSESETDFTVKKKNENIKLTSRGIDDVEFLVLINKGDEFTPLRKTASGGEVSRIMLAIKTVLAGADRASTLIFDEIDTGISGRIAQKAGRVIKKLSESHQVIAVTHLAQIAALANEHFTVEKETDSTSTFTKIRKLNKQEKIVEIAKLISGEKITDASIKSAKQLIESE